MKLAYLFLITVSLFAFFLNTKLFLTNPPIWPDEAIYADVAYNILHHGRLGTDIWADTVSGIHNCACWYPPALFYLIAFWFKVFGFSIEALRSLSLIAGIILAAGFYLVVKDLLKFDLSVIKKPLWVLPLLTGGLILDYSVSVAARIGRPEIFILCFLMLAIYFYLKIFNPAINKNHQVHYAVASGLLAGVSLLFHAMAVFAIPPLVLFFIIIQKKKIIASKKFYAFIISLLLPTTAWLFLMRDDILTILYQYLLAIQGQQFSSNWIISIFRGPLTVYGLNLTLYLLITVLFSLYTFIFSRTRSALLILLLTVSAWTFSAYGIHFWYFVYVIPFVYLCLGVMFSEVFYLPSPKKEIAKLCVGIFFLMLYLNTFLQIYSLNSTSKNSYYEFSGLVTDAIPNSSTVFISAIPDPYFPLRNKENMTLYKFPDFPISKIQYFSLLNRADYIVYNVSFEADYGQFLSQYININKVNVKKIGSKDSYGAFIITLRQRTDRRMPDKQTKPFSI